jgi:uncharacterized protein YcbX
LITVARINVTPVKGLALHHPDEVSLGPDGVVENRRFYLIDDHGLLVNGKRAGILTKVIADSDALGARLALRFPDGPPVAGPVELGEAVVTDFYGRPVAGRVCEGPWASALSERAGMKLRLVCSDVPGDACDVHRLSLLSEASLAQLAGRTGDDALRDDRRFRMLFVLDGCRPHEEDEWDGHRMRIGDALVRVGGPVPRCVVTTLNPDTGVRDADALRAIKAYRGLSDQRTIDFGVYAEVEEPGRVRVGDPVSPAP